MQQRLPTLLLVIGIVLASHATATESDASLLESGLGLADFDSELLVPANDSAYSHLRLQGMLHAISFGNNPFYRNCACNALRNFSIHYPASETHLVSDADLPAWILDLPDTKRGYKHWIWKPVIALQYLARMAPGAVLVYLDSMTGVPARARPYVRFIGAAMAAATGNNSARLPADMMAFIHGGGPNSFFEEEHWSRADLMAQFGVAVGDAHATSNQFWAGAWAVRRTQAAGRFLARWMRFMKEHYDMISFDVGSLPNSPSFMEARNDQSVFSLMVKTHNESDIRIKTRYQSAIQESLVHHGQGYGSQAVNSYEVDPYNPSRFQCVPVEAGAGRANTEAYPSDY